MPNAYVRFIDAALEDLRALQRRDPQIVRAVLKKCILLERSPEAGEPLLGDLIGFRKLTVGDRHWRIVWRTTTDDTGSKVVDIAEIWAAGARADDEIYREMEHRRERVDDSTLRHALSEVISLLEPGAGVDATPEPSVDPVPRWLRNRLVYTAGFSPAHVDAMSGEQALVAWEAHLTGG